MSDQQHLEQQLVGVLAACLSADQAERAAAEAALKQHEAVPGLIVALLRVAMMERAGMAMGVRQVAAIQFKNTVKRRWGAEEVGVAEGAAAAAAGAAPAPAPDAAAATPNTSPLAEADRVAVRENLLEALMAAPHAVQVQLGDAFKAIAYADYPERWPSLLPAIQAALVAAAAAGAGRGADAADPASPVGARMHGALYALRILARKYEFRDEEDRAPLKDLIAATFPALLALLQQLQQNPSPSPQVALHAKLVLKVFWSATFMGVPDALLQQEQFAGWLTCLHHALTTRVPTEGAPTDPDELKAWPWWKAMKWVLHITYRMFSRYGEPKLAREGNDRAFATLLAQHGGGRQLLEDHLALLARLAEGSGSGSGSGSGTGTYLSPRVVNLALQYVGRAIEIKESYKLLRPHIDAMLQSVVFPLVCFGEEDAALWEEDPQEYIRKGYDVIEDMYSTKTAAANVLHVLVTKKPKAHMDKVMAQVAGVFAEHAAAVASSAGGGGGGSGGGGAGGAGVPVALARRMDGALLIVGSLSDVLKSKSPYKEQIETMLMTHVLPCFASPHGHLRAKAAWVAGCYSDIVFAGCGIGAGPHFMLLFERVINGLNDPELPVRVDSVVAMRAFVAELQDMDQLKPILPRLLESIFGLMDQVDSEDLVASLEAIVEALGEDVGPYAVSLAQNLVGAFWKYTSQGDREEEDEDDNACLAAYGCLRSLLTLLDGCTALKPILPKLEDILFPLLQKLLSAEGQDVFEEALEMLAYFTFFEEPISPRLWSLWPAIASCLVEFGVDSWHAILVPLDNLISRDTATFLAGPAYLQSVFDMVRHSLEGADFHEEDIVSAPRLLCVVLQNCRGQLAVDQWVEPYLRLVVERLPRTQRRALKDELMVVVANALYYNPQLAMGALQALGPSHAGALFGEWFGMIFARKKKDGSQHFRTLTQKRAVALGLISLLGVPDAVLPAEIAAGLPQVLAGVLRVLADFVEAERARDEDNEDDEEGGGDAEDDDEADEEDDEEEGFTVVEADDVTQRKLRAAARSFLGRDDDDDDDDDDDSDEWGEDDDDAESPLDAVDPFAFLAEGLQALSQSAPARAQALAAAGGQQLAQAVQMAEVRRREAAEAEAKKQQKQQQP